MTGRVPRHPGLLCRPRGLSHSSGSRPAAHRQKNRRLTQRLIEGAQKAGLTIHTPQPPDRGAGFVAIDFPGADRARDVLIAEGFKLDYRPNCGLRIGPHFYNTEEEISRLSWRLSQRPRH